jgi:hypothetical protein
VTFDGDETWNIYLDKILVATITLSKVGWSVSPYLRYGSGYAGYFTGQIKHGWVAYKAWSQAEINEIFDWVPSDDDGSLIHLQPGGESIFKLKD